MIRAELEANPPPISQEYRESRRVRSANPPVKTANNITQISKPPKRVNTNKGKKINRAPKYPWTTVKVGEQFFVPHKDHKSIGPTRRHADKRYGITTEAYEGRFRGCPGIWIRRVA